jgi:hypothetical protein
MIDLAFVLLAGEAHAQSYGVPDSQGHPNYEERALHLWVNAARVDPVTWQDDGLLDAAGCSINDFAPGEADPKAPLYYNDKLGQVARFHADDMHAEQFVGPESSDGTPMEQRVGLNYPDPIVGEANGAGHTLDYGFVFKGWLCDPEARAVLLSADATELGTGQSGLYATVDVGAGPVETNSPIAQGTHYWIEGTPGDETYVFVDWQRDRTPDKFQVIFQGHPTNLDLYWGTGHQGVWGAVLDVPANQIENSCFQYFFYWELADGTYGTFPETGSLTFGSCASTRGYVEEQVGLNPPEDEKGCATSRASGSLGALAVLAGLLVGRRRR